MNIRNFCDNLSDKEVIDIFGDHQRNCDHLNEPEYIKKRRDALLLYLSHYIERGDNKEREVTLGKCVREKDYYKLKDVIVNDQYFYEPLYTIREEGKIPEWWSEPIIENQ